MTCPAGRRTALVVVALLAVGITVGASGRAQDVSTARKAMVPATVLYGAAYYHEYMPYERLEKDIELMTRAGITVVRVGESTWTNWEPREGDFQFAWMDRVVNAMQAAGIQVVMGTPTYSVPPWLYAKHPEIMVVPLGQVRQSWQFYGPRQNMDITHPVYRQYCERVIRKIAERYAKHPGVIGWQIDNETGAYGTAGPNVQAGFKEWLKRKFGTVEALNKAWGLVYWGQLLGTWDELPPRDGILNPGWKLEWERYQRSLVTDFLQWQAALVREYVPAGQWVTQDFHGATRTAVDSQQVSKFLDIAAINPYHETQDSLDGWWITFMGDFTRSMKRAPYLVTETNAQTTGWDAKNQFPPYRRAAAAAGVGARRERSAHGGVLALALAALRAGDVLERAARPRSRAEPSLRGSDTHRGGAQAPGAAASRDDAEEPRGDPAQRGLALRPAVHADRRQGVVLLRRGPAAPGALPAERGRRLRLRGTGGLLRLRRADRPAALRGERCAAPRSLGTSRKLEATCC